VTAKRCRYCNCILGSAVTKERGYCKFSACVANARSDEAGEPRRRLARLEKDLTRAFGGRPR